MCGRFANFLEREELERLYAARLAEDFDWKPRYSIAPSSRAPVVMERAGDAEAPPRREILDGVWGLRPPWLPAARRGFINARIETVTSKPSFRGAFKKRRVVVPMCGYYEWVAEDKQKQPVFIHLPGGTGVLSAAGLVEWTKQSDDPIRWRPTFTIITRHATDAAGQVHDRMPVFLDDDTLSTWLDPVPVADEAELIALADTVSAEIAATLVAYRVDPRVNKIGGFDPADPSLISPADQ